MAAGKETPRQKMIGMMYLVLTALLAMNVRKAAGGICSVGAALGKMDPATRAKIEAAFVDTERFALTLLDRERQVEPSAKHVEFQFGLVGGHHPLDDVAWHVADDPHDLVAGADPGDVGR